MIWVQGLVAFVVWVAYGYLQARRAERFRQFALARPRALRGIFAAALLVVAVAVLFGGLTLVLTTGGFGEGGMTFLGWIEVILVGIAFIHLQTLALALLVAMVQESVTQGRRPASSSGETQEEKP